MFIILDILIFFAFILLLYRFQSFQAKVFEAVQEAMETGRLSKDKTQKKWEQIKGNISSEKAEDKKKAVALAEKILDDVLKAARFPGGNLEMRLRKIPDSQLNFQDDIVWAFKFKEKLESDYNFAPDEEEIDRAFYIFERALKELNVI